MKELTGCGTFKLNVLLKTSFHFKIDALVLWELTHYLRRFALSFRIVPKQLSCLRFSMVAGFTLVPNLVHFGR